MQVFIAFTRDDDFFLLKQTLEAWDLPGFSPVAVQVLPSKYQIARRVVADKMADSDYYLISDLGCAPSDDFQPEKLKSLPKTEDGMISFANDKNPEELRVALCRKGVIKKWMTRVTDDYVQEHVQSVLLAGKAARICPDIAYRHLPAH